MVYFTKKHLNKQLINKLMGFDKLDLDLWKDIQDKISKELNLPIKLLDPQKNTIISSGTLPFYIQLINKKDPSSINNKNGLINITQPILLHLEEIGSLTAGPIGFDKSFDLKELSQNLNIDEEELKDAANDIIQLDENKKELYNKFLSLFAEILPKITFQQYKREKDLTKLKTMQNIVKKINSTLELEEILNYIMNFLVNSLNATDCSVFVYDEEQEKKYILKPEAEKMSEIEKKVSQKALEEKRPIIVKDIKQRFSINVSENYNAIFTIPLKLRQETIGTISLYDKTADLKQEDIEFISVIADQIAIAIANAKKFQEVKELAVIDKLTGAFNRRHFTDLLEKEFQEKINLENPLSLILLDIDNFGNYNNTHGHPKGDELLKELSRLLKQNIRKQDSLGRYGGEEFIVLLPKTKQKTALEIAEKIKNSVSQYPFEGRETQPQGKVTISLGLAVCRTNIPSKELIKEADSALYKAKNSGKNKVVQKIILTNNLKTEI